jgi:hypothetical protein
MEHRLAVVGSLLVLEDLLLNTFPGDEFFDPMTPRAGGC